MFSAIGSKMSGAASYMKGKVVGSGNADDEELKDGEDENQEVQSPVSPNGVKCQQNSETVYEDIPEATRLEHAKQIQELALKLEISEQTGQVRCPTASPSGGFQLLDAAATSVMRGAIVEWMKLLGKKMYAGDF